MEYDVISNYRVSAASQKEQHPVKASRRDYASLVKGGGLPQASRRDYASLVKGGGLPQASRRDFLKKINFKKKVLRCLIPQSSSMTAPFTREPNLIPQSTHFVRSQLPFQGSLLTFPHTVGNHPLQGSLNNPSVTCGDSSLYKGA